MAKKKITAEMLLEQSDKSAEITSSPLSDYNDAFLFGGEVKPIIVKDGDKIDIPLEHLKSYDNQPFKMYTDDKLQELSENIKLNGIISPLTVRPIENTDDYQILAGHNRKAAAELAGLVAVPCIVRYVDDEQAQLILVDTNLNQREEILPSERAFAYKLRMDALKNQGKRTDTQLVEQSSTSSTKSRDSVDEHLSGRQVQKYIRLTYLYHALLVLVDSKIIPVNAGVELSYIENQDIQRVIYNQINGCRIEKLTIEQAKQMRRIAAENTDIDVYVIRQILDGKYQEPVEVEQQTSEVTSSEYPNDITVIPATSLAPPDYIPPVRTETPATEDVKPVSAPTAPEIKDEVADTDDFELTAFQAKVATSMALKKINELRELPFYDSVDKELLCDIAEELRDLRDKYSAVFDKIQ